MSRLTGLSIYQIFAALNVHALMLFALAGYRIAGRLTNNVVGRFAAAWALVFGLNAFGWIFFLAHGSQNPDRWYSLVVPFAMVRSYSPSLGSLIHEFLDGGPFAMSFAFDVVWLDAVLSRMDGERGRALVLGALMLTGALYLHLFGAVFLVAASVIALLIVLAIDRRRSIAERGMLLFDVGAMVVAAALVTAPYAWNILGAQTAEPVSATVDFDFIRRQAWSLITSLALVIMLALPAVWLAVRSRHLAALFLFAFAVTITML